MTLFWNKQLDTCGKRAAFKPARTYPATEYILAPLSFSLSTLLPLDPLVHFVSGLTTLNLQDHLCPLWRLNVAT